MRRSWLASLLVLGLAGCGSMSDAERFSLTTPGTDDLIVREIEGSQKAPPKKPTKAEKRVIRGWADALRAGHFNKAARFFAIPARVNDGSFQHDLPDREAVLEFNRGLTCGARLVDAVRGEGRLVKATFRLTERARPGRPPCTGVGTLAATSFLIEDRHIVQWLREPDPVEPPADDDKS